MKFNTDYLKSLIGFLIIGILGVFLVITANEIIKFSSYINKFIDNNSKIVENIELKDFTRFGDTKIYDRSRKIIGVINNTGFRHTHYEELPRYITQGYIAVEDRRFFEHDGLDIKGISRAFTDIVKNRGKITQGGSTITQQVLKNNIIGTNENKFKRKIKEFIIAPEFEKKFDKNQIMEFYVNTNPYGNNCIGIYSASHFYFNKEPRDLNALESAFLVGISNAPTRYNPKTHPERSKEKTQSILKILYNENVVNKDEYERFKDKDLQFTYTREKNGITNPIVNFTINELTRLVISEYKKVTPVITPIDEKDLFNSVRYIIMNSGLEIHTTLDLELQNKTIEILNKELQIDNSKTDKGIYNLQGAVTIIDNKTFDILAIVGSRNREDEFNRALYGYRQPGSAIKPILVYAPAFETGRYYPSKKLYDIEEVYKLENGKEYSPRNAYRGFKGKISLRDALAVSTNTIPYKIMIDITPKFAISFLDNMDYKKIGEMDRVNNVVALGGFTNGVTTTELARSYATLVNNGLYVDKTFISSVRIPDLNTLNINSTKEFQDNFNKISKICKTYKTGDILNSMEKYTKNKIIKKQQVYNSDISYMTLDLMMESVKQNEGTSHRAAKYNYELAGKTGTTNNKKDAWFVGVNPSYTTVVWTGYDKPKELSFGGNGKPIDIFNKVSSIIEVKTNKFNKPEGVVERNIDSNGYITDNKTGIYDIFSKRLVDKNKFLSEEEKKEIKNQELVVLSDKTDLNIDTILNLLYYEDPAVNIQKIKDLLKEINENIYELNQNNKELSQKQIDFSSQSVQIEIDIENIENSIRNDNTKNENGNKEIDKSESGSSQSNPLKNTGDIEHPPEEIEEYTSIFDQPL